MAGTLFGQAHHLTPMSCSPAQQQQQIDRARTIRVGAWYFAEAIPSDARTLWKSVTTEPEGAHSLAYIYAVVQRRASEVANGYTKVLATLRVRMYG